MNKLTKLQSWEGREAFSKIVDEAIDMTADEVAFVDVKHYLNVVEKGLGTEVERAYCIAQLVTEVLVLDVEFLRESISGGWDLYAAAEFTRDIEVGTQGLQQIATHYGVNGEEADRIDKWALDQLDEAARETTVKAIEAKRIRAMRVGA